MTNSSKRIARLRKTAVSGIALQLITLACGFVLPWLILQNFGSEVNGIVNSITKFLGMISFLELGMGAVVPSALYKPLAAKDQRAISEIVVSAQDFFTRLGLILCVYVAVLVVVFPYLNASSFDSVYTGTLIISISISLFAQYFFGIVNGLLIRADQRGYVVNRVQAFALILNTIFCYFIIKAGGSIQLVKFVGSIVFLICPAYLWFYVKNNYSINRKAKAKEEPIKQKWNGIAQHISALLIDSTPVILLSIFTSFSVVSVFSVYSMVVSGVRGLLLSVTGGISPVLGELFARGETEALTKAHSWVEWTIHTTTTVIFCITALTIVPFVLVFTKGISDTNYDVSVFALLLCFGISLHCYRLPYNIMILAVNKFKETQICYIVATVLTLAFSFVGVLSFGLEGVSIGLIISMGYQIIWMFEFNRKNIINLSRRKFFYQIFVDITVVSVSIALSMYFTKTSTNYYEWIIYASKISFVTLLSSAVVNLLFFKEKMKTVLERSIAVCLR